MGTMWHEMRQTARCSVSWPQEQCSRPAKSHAVLLFIRPHPMRAYANAARIWARARTKTGCQSAPGSAANGHQKKAKRWPPSSAVSKNQCDSSVPASTRRKCQSWGSNRSAAAQIVRRGGTGDAGFLGQFAACPQGDDFASLARALDQLYTGQWVTKHQQLRPVRRGAEQHRAELFDRGRHGRDHARHAGQRSKASTQYLRSKPTSRPWTLTRSGGKMRVS